MNWSLQKNEKRKKIVANFCLYSRKEKTSVEGGKKEREREFSNIEVTTAMR